MKLSFLAFLALALGIFQLTLLDYFRVFGARPDLFLVCVVIASLFLSPRQAILFSIALGVFKDSFSPQAFGLDILLFSLWSYLIINVTRSVSLEDNLSQALLAFVAALLQNIVSGAILAYSGSFIPFGIFTRIVFIGSIYTALVFLLILKLVRARI